MSDVLVLCYHAVSEEWPCELAIRPADLRAQIAALLERGFEPTTFTQAVTTPPGRLTLAVTFDDGFRSVRELGLPVLQELGVPATLFVPSAYMGSDQAMVWPGVGQWGGTRWERELQPSTWEEIAELQAAGWEIGSHSVSHPYLTQLADAELARELEVSRTTIEERLGGACTSIAYPYGDVDERVIAAAWAAGYWAAASLPERWGPEPGPLDWPRLAIGRDDSAARVRRRTSRPYRRLWASGVWGFAPFAIGALHRLRPNDSGPPYGGLRLLTDGGRVGRGHARKLGVAARAGRSSYTLWPSVTAPLLVVPTADAGVARWMQATFQPRAGLRARVHPELWQLLRASGVIAAEGVPMAVTAAEQALGRGLQGARVAAYSPTGAPLQKTTCFVFEAGSEAPTVVVKAMAARGQSERFAHELDVVEELRRRLADRPDVAEALPSPPLWRGEIGGDLIIVEALDPLASRTGQPDVNHAYAWLVAFQAATTSETTTWGAADVRAAVGALRLAWGFGRPRTERGVIGRVSQQLEALAGAEIPWCAVHGDFWRGNLAGAADALRVFDWEWAAVRGRPFQDLWTYELAGLREDAKVLDETVLAERFGEATTRVERRFAQAGIDPAFAAAVAAPALAELSFRARIVLGVRDPNEAGAVRVMAALERTLG